MLPHGEGIEAPRIVPKAAAAAGSAAAESDSDCALLLAPYSLQIPLSKSALIFPTASPPVAAFSADLHFTLRTGRAVAAASSSALTLTLSNSAYEAVHLVGRPFSCIAEA